MYELPLQKVWRLKWKKKKQDLQNSAKCQYVTEPKESFISFATGYDKVKLFLYRWTEEKIFIPKALGVRMKMILLIVIIRICNCANTKKIHSRFNSNYNIWFYSY